MNRETIEKTAKEYAKDKYGGENAKQYAIAQIHAGRDGFIDGAQWRINSVWHEADEKPNKNQLILFECRRTYGKGYSVNFGENYELLKNVLISWAYVSDLMPDRKEATL